ncbi:MAG: hypothetical protein QM756_42145 [Polyangiaceae bacterium]
MARSALEPDQSLRQLPLLALGYSARAYSPRPKLGLTLLSLLLGVMIGRLLSRAGTDKRAEPPRASLRPPLRISAARRRRLQ